MSGYFFVFSARSCLPAAGILPSVRLSSVGIIGHAPEPVCLQTSANVPIRTPRLGRRASEIFRIVQAFGLSPKIITLSLTLLGDPLFVAAGFGCRIAPSFAEVWMCNWAVVPVHPQYPEEFKNGWELSAEGLPRFDPKYESLIRGKGRRVGHPGLHTLHGLIEGADYQIERNLDGSTDRIPAASCSALYSALVKLKLRSGNRGTDAWERDFKLSTFFPDTMCTTHIKEATTKAYLFWKAVTENSAKHADRMAEIEKIASGPIKWAGKVKLAPGRQEFVIWIGSLQAGESDRTRLYDSFPTFAGNFVGVVNSAEDRTHTSTQTWKLGERAQCMRAGQH